MTPSRTNRLLLVDDQPANIRVLAEALDGYELRFATSAEKALEMAREGGVDLILLDVVMPDMDGFEVCRLMKGDQRTASIPIIFVTALGDVEDETKGFDAGGVDYIAKPISPPVVRARVKTHLDLQRQNEILREVERLSRHDLKTPLNGILQFASLLSEDESLTPDQHRSVQTIERAGYQMLEMINGSLDLFRIEQGTYRPSPVRLELRDVIDRVVTDLGELAQSRGVRCEVRGNAIVRGEDLLTYSMFANLVKNAVEASAVGEVVAIDLGDAAVRIANRGAVPTELRERFFEKYATAGKRGGTGLGTYSARLMAEIQGGSIALDARDDETIVTVTLPAPVLRTVDNDKARAFLVADDDEATRVAMRRFLARPNWSVDEAANGAVAAEKFETGAYDFVFMDLEMPVLSGLEAAAKMSIRKRDAVLVALSSHDDETSRGRALAAGYDAYLTKPATRDQLLEIVLGSVVHVDPDIADLIPDFLAGKREEIEGLRSETAERIASESHRLRGSFRLYGFTEAARLCGAIEQQASDSVAVARLVADLTRHLETMRIENAS